MNTEILNTLKAVQEARTEATKAFAKPALTDAERLVLEPIIIHLSNLEGSLLNKVKEELIEALTKDTEPLQALVEEIERSIKKLERIATLVKSVSEKIEALINIIGIAASVGI